MASSQWRRRRREGLLDSPSEVVKGPLVTLVRLVAADLAAAASEQSDLDSVPEALQDSINPFPYPIISDMIRIFATVPTSPRAVRDRSRDSVGGV